MILEHRSVRLLLKSAASISRFFVYMVRTAMVVTTRVVLRLVWPSLLLLFIERWRHLADSNEPNFINKSVFLFNWVTGSPPKFDKLLASWYPSYIYVHGKFGPSNMATYVVGRAQTIFF